MGLCPRNFGSNVLVNQNCLNVTDTDLQGRGQAQNETAIAQNPSNPRQLVAGFNDYRRGDGTCGTAFSGNGGASWTDSTMPNGFTRGTAFGNVARQYWQAGGDPSVAWDSRGNAYYACQVFMRGPSTTNNPDQSSAIYVFRSTGDAGASWNFTGHPAIETFDTTGATLNDKPYMAVDSSPTSPFRDRIYVTWTFFAADGTGYIYEVHSDDYGQTFSSPVVVSTTSSLCSNTFGLPTPQGTCNENQFSDPFTAPNGTLYVAYANFNNSATSSSDNHNQILLTKLHRRREHLQRPDPGGQLQRPARLRHLPRRAGRRPGLRPGKGHRAELSVPGDQLPRRRGEPAQAQPGRGHLRLLHQPRLQRVQRVHARRASAPSAPTCSPV